LVGREQNLVALLLRKPALQAPFTSPKEAEQAPLAFGRGGIDPKQGLAAKPIVGNHNVLVLGSGLHEQAQRRRAQPRHIDGAEQQLAAGVEFKQALEGDQRSLLGSRLADGLDPQLSLLVELGRQFPMAPVGRQQGHGLPQAGQQAQLALQPAAAFGMGQQGLVLAHAPAIAATEQAGP
jgi:hypothetical protein